MLTRQQQTAISNTCRLGEETRHPMFSRVDPPWSEVLTFNSGYE